MNIEQKETIYHWNIMCDKCHKIISKEYTEDILAKVREEGKAQALADVMKIIDEYPKEFIMELETSEQVERFKDELKSKLQEQKE